MKLHQQTVDYCERIYKSKAEAHFYGIAAGSLFMLIAALLAFALFVIKKC